MYNKNQYTIQFAVEIIHVCIPSVSRLRRSWVPGKPGLYTHIVRFFLRILKFNTCIQTFTSPPACFTVSCSRVIASLPCPVSLPLSRKLLSFLTITWCSLRKMLILLHLTPILLLLMLTPSHLNSRIFPELLSAGHFQSLLGLSLCEVAVLDHVLLYSNWGYK